MCLLIHLWKNILGEGLHLLKVSGTIIICLTGLEVITKVPNLLQLYNPFKFYPLLVKSFFGGK